MVDKYKGLSHQDLWDFTRNLDIILGVMGRDKRFEVAE